MLGESGEASKDEDVGKQRVEQAMLECLLPANENAVDESRAEAVEKELEQDIPSSNASMV